jgi:hypothetical protein
LKSKGIPLLILLMVLAGCSVDKPDEMPPLRRLNQFQNIQANEFAEIKVVKSSTTVKVGGTASITIQGTPGTVYDITSTYRHDNQLVTSVQSKTADASGIVTFNWVIGARTASGSYPLSVTGGGKTLISYYTVVV